jgi:hypothetical protein
MPPRSRRGPSSPVLLPGTPIHGLDSLTLGREYRLDRYSWYPPNPVAVFTSMYGGQNLEALAMLIPDPLPEGKGE